MPNLLAMACAKGSRLSLSGSALDLPTLEKKSMVVVVVVVAVVVVVVGERGEKVVTKIESTGKL